MLAARNARSTDKREHASASSSRSAKALQVSRFEFRETGAANFGFLVFLETRNPKLETVVNLPAPPSWWDGAMGTNPERFRPKRAPQRMQSKLRRLSWHR